MGKRTIEQIAKNTIDGLVPGQSEDVADMTVVHYNADLTFSVTDNGEQVTGLTRKQAVKIIVENLS